MVPVQRSMGSLPKPSLPRLQTHVVMVRSFKFLTDIVEGTAVNSQRCLACNKPWVDSVQDFELARGSLAQFEKGAADSVPVMSASPRGTAPGSAWSQGSPFAPKVASLPQHIRQKVPFVFRSAFDGIIERSLPAVEADAIYDEFKKQANNGS